MSFKSLKNRRKVNLDPLGHVVRQMQGLIDTDPVSEEAKAFHGLVAQWHAMLQAALVEEAKHS